DFRLGFNKLVPETTKGKGFNQSPQADFVSHRRRKTMIAALSWLPKGVAKSVPAVAEPPSKEEIEELLKSRIQRSGESGSEAEDDDGDMDVDKQSDGVVIQARAVAEAVSGKPKAGCDNIVDGLAELNMHNYDDEDEDVEIFSSGIGDVYYPSNDLDPYLKDNDDDDSEEEEDLAIKADDAVIVCARNEDELSHLEVWICEDSGDDGLNMYIHHDVILSAFPLCVAWLDCPLKGGEKGNFIAVGSMEPAIEIWDLDIIDEVQPSAVLGGVAEEKKKKKKKKKGKKVSIKYKEGSHTDSVLGLAWNKQYRYRNVLASASADSLVKIWDVATEKCSITMAEHTDKVQAVAWNHHEAQILLSGSFDRSVIKDGRNTTSPGIRWSVAADVESLAWDPHSSHSFVVSLEDGTVQGFDIRTATSGATSDLKPSYTIHAHDKAVCTVAYNPSVPNLLATGSTDKMVKVWDLSNNQPSCVASTNPKAGGVFSISFSEDNPFMMAIGGSKGKLEVWDTLSDAGVSRRFGDYNKNKNDTEAS
ncbi:Periodic tryptophan protein 1 homolog, partial [Linum perenne]